MKRALFFLAASFLLFAIGWKVVEACSCGYQHPQTQFCNSDFVILAVPKTIVDNGTHMIYTIRWKSTFRANSAARNALKKREIITGLDSCGVILNTSVTYILSGSIYNGKPFINLCQFNSPWKDITQEKRDKLEQYKHACGCTIDLCGVLPCTKTKYSCLYNNTFTNSYNCYSKYGVCTKNHAGVCDWVKSRRKKYAKSPLAKCLNTTDPFV